MVSQARIYSVVRLDFTPRLLIRSTGATLSRLRERALQRFKVMSRLILLLSSLLFLALD